MNKTLKLNILALVLSLAFLAGCGTMQKAGNSISSWWSKPTTQENVQNLKEAVFSIAVAAGTEAVSELATDRKVNVGRVGMVAGAAALYTAANYLRTLQSTDAVLSNEAISAKLKEAGVPAQNAPVLADIIAGNAQTLSERGISKDAASELSASAFDAAARAIQEGAK